MPLVGRDAERVEIERFLVDAAHEPVVLLLEGEAGIGKSALLDASIAAAAGFTLMTCRCAQSESTLGYAGLIDLIGDDLTATIQRLPVPLRRALDVALLRADPGAEIVERQAVARAVLTLLQDLTRTRPVLIGIDDLQWLDGDSRDVLTFALRRLDTQPVGVVATVRLSEPAASAASFAVDDLRRIRVAAMTDADLEAMLALRLSTPPPRGKLRRVYELSGGNPFYALELCRASDATSDEPAVPPSLQALLLQRITRLPASTRSVLAAIALLRSPRRPLVARALEREVASCDSDIDRALDDGVLIEDDGRLRFVHPLYGSAVTSAVGYQVRRQINRRLAELATDSEDRARHLALSTSEPDEDVATAIEAGAARARARAAPDVAAELADAAVRLTPAALESIVRSRTIDAAYHHVAAGAVRVGLSRMRAALDAATSAGERADVLWRCGMLHFLAGELDDCVATLEEARGEAEDPAQRSIIARRLASMRVWMGQFRIAKALADQALEADEHLEAHELQALISLSAQTSYLLGDGIRDGVIERLEALTSQLGAPGPQEHWLSRFGPIVMHARGPAGARALLAPLHAAAVDAADDLGLAWVGAWLAQTELAAGRWDLAAKLADEVLRAARRSASPPALLMGHEATAHVAALHGEHERAREAAAALINHASGDPLIWRVGTGHVVLGFLALSTGDAAAASEAFIQAEDALRQLEVAAARVPLLRWYHPQALAEAGDLQAAEAAAAQLAEYGARVDDPLASLAALRAMALVHSARGEHDEAQPAMKAALDVSESLGWPFEQAMTLFVYGHVQRRARRNRSARELLQSARDGFAALGAPLWLARANAELARIGGRTAQLGKLTDAEQRIAQLAADGLTNQEIAERLFLSTKTVATHLSNAYAKLAVRSRTELARRLHDAS